MQIALPSYETISADVKSMLNPCSNRVARRKDVDDNNPRKTRVLSDCSRGIAEARSRISRYYFHCGRIPPTFSPLFRDCTVTSKLVENLSSGGGETILRFSVRKDKKRVPIPII